jgi:hypothetical protein
MTYRFFGELIGSDHLDVWFWKQVPPGSATSQAHVTKDNIDVQRPADYAKVYGLSLNERPYVVMMRAHPRDAQSRAC